MLDSQNNQSNNISCIFGALIQVFTFFAIIIVLSSEFWLIGSHCFPTDSVQNIILILSAMFFVISRSMLGKNIKKDLIIAGLFGIIGFFISDFLLRINGTRVMFYAEYIVLVFSAMLITVGIIKPEQGMQKVLIIFGFLSLSAVLASEFILKNISYQIDFAQDAIFIFSTMLIVTYCIEWQRENKQIKSQEIKF